nr:deoxycytidylate deaminase-like isoform X2 [Plodia interpunctella]
MQVNLNLIVAAARYKMHHFLCSTLMSDCCRAERTLKAAKPREKYLSWEDYFMELAILSAKRSKDPQTQVGGACIVNDDYRIVGLGYNGMPNGCPDSDFPWGRPDKMTYVCHAEINAIVNKYVADLKNCKI